MRYLVTKCVDAFVHYQAIVEATDAAHAQRIAKGDNLDWVTGDISEYDHVDFENIPPELVPDDFKLPTIRDADSALRAIKARVNGEWDQPDLFRFGPLGSLQEDILRIIQSTGI